MNRSTLNAILFQISWWAIVLGASRAAPFLYLVPLSMLAAHYFYCRTDKIKEFVFLICATFIGFTIDSILAWQEVMIFTSEPKWPFAPPWLLYLWVVFPTTIGFAFRWLMGRYLLAAVLGFIFGPLTYYIGVRFDLIEFPDLVQSLLLIAIVWMLILPLLIFMYWKIHGGLKWISKTQKS